MASGIGMTILLPPSLPPSLKANFFFRKKPNVYLFNFKSATDGRLINLIFEKKKFDRVPKSPPMS
jgi:hypothetical protein